MYGRLSDMIGRKPLLYVGIGVFLLGSALCGAAQNITWLCIARGVQGVGGGAIQALTSIIVSDITTLQQRPLFLNLISLTWAVSAVCGPLLGGALAESVGWRWWCVWSLYPEFLCVFGVFMMGLHWKKKKRNRMLTLVVGKQLLYQLAFRRSLCFPAPMAQLEPTTQTDSPGICTRIRLDRSAADRIWSNLVTGWIHNR